VEQADQHSYSRGVMRTDRRHRQDFAFDELDPRIGRNDPGLAHAMVLIDIDEEAKWR